MGAIGVSNATLLIGAVLVIAGILSSLIAKRFGAPILLIFLGLGMLAGVDGPGGISFYDYQTTYLIGALALAIILFDGGLRTHLSAIRGSLGPATMLATVGVVVTAAIAGGFAMWVFGLNVYQGFLLGAVLASTDAAAVFFLLRTGGLQLRTHVGVTLEMESGINDPVAVFLTFAAVGLIVSGADAPGWEVLWHLARDAAIGGGIGIAGGFALVALLNRVDLPTGLHPLLTIAAAVGIYALAAVAGGSGFLAAYLAGLVVGNRPVRAYASILSLHDAVTWLVQIVMFLVLGLLVDPGRLVDLGLPALAVSLFLIFVARPAAVWLCLQPFGFTAREKLFVSWTGLRGAVSIFLASVPMLVGLPNALLYFNTAFVVVLVSLLLQGWTVKAVALRLKQALPRSDAPVSRVELDLPGQLDAEMVGYPIGADSRVLMVSVMPEWVRPVLVVRNKQILEPAQAGELRAGDYAYFLAPMNKVHRLDRLFASTAEHHPIDPIDSEFPIRGDASVGALDKLYELKLTDEDDAMTVAQLFAERFDRSPEVGDVLPLGNCLLVVRAMDGDEVSRAGLQVAENENDFVDNVRGRLAIAARRFLARNNT